MPDWMDLPSSPPTEEVAAEDLDVLGPVDISVFLYPNAKERCRSKRKGGSVVRNSIVELDVESRINQNLYIPLVFSGMRQPDIVGVCPSMILRYRRTVAIRNAS